MAAYYRAVATRYYSASKFIIIVIVIFYILFVLEKYCLSVKYNDHERGPVVKHYRQGWE